MNNICGGLSFFFIKMRQSPVCESVCVGVEKMKMMEDFAGEDLLVGCHSIKVDRYVALLFSNENGRTVVGGQTPISLTSNFHSVPSHWQPPCNLLIESLAPPFQHEYSSSGKAARDFNF